MEKSLKWGLKNYFKPTPAKIKRFLLAWKAIIGGTAFTAMADENWIVAIVIGIIGFVVNEATEFIAEHYGESDEPSAN